MTSPVTTVAHRLTRINTTGGLLRQDIPPLWTRGKASQIGEVLNLIQSACPHRTEPTPLEKGLLEYSANFLALDASHFIRVSSEVFSRCIQQVPAWMTIWARTCLLVKTASDER